MVSPGSALPQSRRSWRLAWPGFLLAAPGRGSRNGWPNPAHRTACAPRVRRSAQHCRDWDREPRVRGRTRGSRRFVQHAEPEVRPPGGWGDRTRVGCSTSPKVHQVKPRDAARPGTPAGWRGSTKCPYFFQLVSGLTGSPPGPRPSVRSSLSGYSNPVGRDHKDRKSIHSGEESARPCFESARPSRRTDGHSVAAHPRAGRAAGSAASTTEAMPNVQLHQTPLRLACENHSIPRRTHRPARRGRRSWTGSRPASQHHRRLALSAARRVRPDRGSRVLSGIDVGLTLRGGMLFCRRCPAKPVPSASFQPQDAVLPQEPLAACRGRDGEFGNEGRPRPR